MRSLLMVLVALLLTLGSGCSGNDSGDSNVTLQPITFADLKDRLAGSQGKVVLLAFWADF